MIFGAVLVAGCTESDSDGGPGPLDAGGADVGTVCLPTDDGTVTMGGEVLHNASRADVIIDKVALVNARGLTLVDSVVVPIANNAVGYASTYPPSSDFLSDPGVEWSRRAPAVGAAVSPGPAPGNANLLAGIRVTGGSGSSLSGLVINYHAKDGKSYQASTPVGLVVKVAPDKCS